jgi:hypothetical protein
MRQPQIVPGTRVSLVPPEGFILADRFTGYIYDNDRVSIIVTEIPGDFFELAASFTNPSELEKKDLLWLNTERVTIDLYNGFLIKAQQTVYGIDFLKWILLLGNETESVILIATVPKHLEVQYLDILKQSLLTTHWNRERSSPLSEDLAFKVNEYGDLKLAKQVTNALLYTKNGVFPAPSIDEPIFVVVPSVIQQFADPEPFAKKRILAIESISELKIESSQRVVVNNLKGYEIIATGREMRSQQSMVIYQTILFDRNDYYYIIQGQIGKVNSQKYLPLFRMMATSFKLK